ncbi:hypothetical protein [Vibrio sp. D431a]|uniref:hypothetical protein n=1 Tax=Vibrio sp. D431a TaxID=2837388 RepID=UPI002556F292|nr:hypothetical protein [Vibrio sp. D431a]MDK9790147.1 hypothetical protein [Vibrio sp. D431a]
MRKIRALRFLDTLSAQSASAETPIGKYEIYRALNTWCAEFSQGNGQVVLSRAFDITKDEAIAICQNDFSERVLSCFE